MSRLFAFCPTMESPLAGTIRILLLLSALAGAARAQTWTGRVVDGQDGNPLAFVAVLVKGTQAGTYSDIDGYFSIGLPQPDAVLQFRFLGYKTTEITPGAHPPGEVLLYPEDTLLPEVTVRPGVNPAERIMRLAIENRKINNPESARSFSYESYNKLIFTAAFDSTQSGSGPTGAATDSSTLQMIKFFSEQHLMMMESVSRRRYMPPGRSEETIIANKVSGFKRPEFAMLGTELQSFSVYTEEVFLLGKPYLSPLSKVAISRYLFIIEDTTFQNRDTIFTLSFRPRKGVNTAALKGQVFINTDGYAVQQIIAEASETSDSFNISIRQQYEKVGGIQWFPVQLNSDIVFSNVNINGHNLIGYGNCYLRNIELDPVYRAGTFKPVTLQLAKGATEAPDSIWNQYRQHPLDARELKTYHVIDSVGDAKNLDELVKLMEVLASGLIPVGPVAIELNRIVRLNDYEGLRLGLGLRTSEKLSRRGHVGGYFAYGFKDRAYKYGGEFLAHINRSRNARLRLFHEVDVAESGVPAMVVRTGLLDASNLYPFFVSRMDQYEKTGFEISGRAIRNISATVFGWQRQLTAFEPYQFTVYRGEPVQLVQSQFTVFETGVSLRYAPGEKLARFGQREIVLGGRLPVFLLRMTTSVHAWERSDISFLRLEGQADKTFRIRNTGDLSLRLYGGWVNNDVPLSWTYNVPGSYDFFGLATPYAFETVRTNEFQHSSWAVLFVRHNFRDLLFRFGSFRPHLVLVHNTGWGKLSNADEHSVAINTMQHVFFESGFQLDNLIKTSFSGFGIGAFYRYGAYHLPGLKENIALKISTSVSF